MEGTCKFLSGSHPGKSLSRCLRANILLCMLQEVMRKHKKLKGLVKRRCDLFLVQILADAGFKRLPE